MGQLRPLFGPEKRKRSAKVAEAAPEQDNSPHIRAILTTVLIVVGPATNFPEGRFVALARMRLDTPQA